MAKMVRKQVYIDARQERSLKRRARSLGVPEAELIRRGIDALDQGAATTDRDPTQWRAARAFILRHRRPLATGATRTWRRDELYEERLHARPR